MTQLILCSIVRSMCYNEVKSVVCTEVYIFLSCNNQYSSEITCFCYICLYKTFCQFCYIFLRYLSRTMIVYSISETETDKRKRPLLVSDYGDIISHSKSPVFFLFVYRQKCTFVSGYADDHKSWMQLAKYLKCLPTSNIVFQICKSTW